MYNGIKERTKLKAPFLRFIFTSHSLEKASNPKASERNSQLSRSSTKPLAPPFPTQRRPAFDFFAMTSSGSSSSRGRIPTLPNKDRRQRLLWGGVAAAAATCLLLLVGLPNDGRELSSYVRAVLPPKAPEHVLLPSLLFLARRPQEEDESSVVVARPTPYDGDDNNVPIPTIDCPALLEQAAQNALGIPDPNAGLKLEAYQRRTSHGASSTDHARPFWISLHRPDHDDDARHSSLWKEGKHPDQPFEALWRHLLHDSPEGSHVLEVGGNVGYFALAAVSLGRSHIVDAFEPHPLHALRVCESLVRNGWATDSLIDNDDNSPGLHWHPVGVADSNEFLPFAVPHRRKHRHSHDEADAAMFYRRDSPALTYTPHTNASVVTLDTWAERQGWFNDKDNDGAGSSSHHNRPATILHIASGVPEPHRVVKGATKLLRSGAVRHVLLAVSAATESRERRARKALWDLVAAGYHVAACFGTTAELPLPRGKNGDATVEWILKKARKQQGRPLNLWWTLSTD